jgi:hypothetical protein
MRELRSIVGSSAETTIGSVANSLSASCFHKIKAGNVPAEAFGAG